MSIKVKIFYPELQRLIGDPASIRLEGKTVGECLQDLMRQFPGSKKLLLNDQGKLLKQVYVYVNTESILKAEFSRPIGETDVLMIAVLITGG
jgi:molybdopterin converting factor small subunit